MFNIFIKNHLKSNLLNTLQAVNYSGAQFYGSRSYTKRKQQQPTRAMYRTWEPTVPEHCHNQQRQQLDQKMYKILSYNILAQDLLVEHLHLYINIDPQLLKWEHRMRRLKEEIGHIKPDILCLQEMQFNHLKTLVRHIKGHRQLEYIFKKKTGHRTDGCAIIYDKKKFKLLDERGIEYYTPGNTLLNRENIAIMAKFMTREDKASDFIVATTHLLYNPKRQDVRMAQVDVLMAELTKFSKCGKNTRSNLRLPILLTGDFNFISQSTPFEVLTTPYKLGQPQLNETAAKQTATTTANGQDNLELSPLNIGSASASTFQDKWITVDYILHTIGKNRENMKIWSVYKLPLIRDCMQIGRIPNRFLGSDHFSLAVMFSF